MRAPEVRITVPVCIEPDEGGFHAWTPALPGCRVGGATSEEARANLKEAVVLHLRSMRKHGEPWPIGCKVECRGAGQRESHAPSCENNTLPGIEPGLVAPPQNEDVMVPV
jgi:predicted RNase H-like HicB family nuclease